MIEIVWACLIVVWVATVGMLIYFFVRERKYNHKEASIQERDGKFLKGIGTVIIAILSGIAFAGLFFLDIIFKTNTSRSLFEKEKKIPKIDNNEKQRRQVERGKVTPGLRYDIMERDGFKCCLCGRTADDGVELEVDHIIPISKGGRSDKENLRTLCRDCNRGKGAK